MWRTVFDVEAKRKKIKEIENEMQKPDFWQDKEKAVKLTQELSEFQEEVIEFDYLKLQSADLKTEADIEQFKKILEQKEIQVFLSGKYDRGAALLSIVPGAGGQDAQDWATMLSRMYVRYCERQGFSVKALHQSFGESSAEGRVGTKSVTLEIRGTFAFGFLKKENGVHRLVRQSPFSAKSLRHTSFAMVEVMPEISSDEDLEIKPEDLRIDTYRASGPGGQNVNKRESAIRITHLPTNLMVSCQLERLQGKNKEQAMKMLRAKLYQLKEREKAKEMAKLKGKQVLIEWGSQIRSYVLHPYKLVKDLRTQVETSDAEGVLDGKLEQFIEAEVKHD
ncbi:MAG: peptide chain release factor 2 [Candidatus Nealsonbacteria bacterium]